MKGTKKELGVTNEAKKTGVYLLILNTILLKQWCPGPDNQIPECAVQNLSKVVREKPQVVCITKPVVLNDF